MPKCDSIPLIDNDEKAADEKAGMTEFGIRNPEFGIFGIPGINTLFI